MYWPEPKLGESVHGKSAVHTPRLLGRIMRENLLGELLLDVLEATLVVCRELIHGP